MSANTISIEDIRRKLEEARPLLLIDVRTPAEFHRVHARGAELMPLDQLDASLVCSRRKSENEPIFIICETGGRAAKAAEKLAQAQVTQVYCVEGGTRAWQAAGLPVEIGKCNAISLERQVRIGAGALVLISLGLAWAVHPLFLLLATFVGAGLVFAGVTDYCGMAMLLAKMPWNRWPKASASC